jgi:hypothetical protein
MEGSAGGAVHPLPHFELPNKDRMGPLAQPIVVLNMAIAARKTIVFFIGVLLHEWIWGRTALRATRTEPRVAKTYNAGEARQATLLIYVNIRLLTLIKNNA